MEANLDDMNPEFFAHVYEKLLAAGALDVFLTSIQMKKGRPGLKLSVLCREEQKEELAEIIFRETTTLGIRYSTKERTLLKRQVEKLQTGWGPVRIKVAYYRGEVVNMAPEYEDLLSIARSEGLPLKKVYRRINSLLNGKDGS